MAERSTVLKRMEQGHRLSSIYVAIPRSTTLIRASLRRHLGVLILQSIPTPTPCAHRSPLPIHATCPTHLILDFTTHTILGKEYRSFSSSLCNFLHSPVAWSLIGPNTLLNILWYSHTPSAYVSPSMSVTKFHTNKNNGQNYSCQLSLQSILTRCGPVFFRLYLS
jgi:hypothetical protein